MCYEASVVTRWGRAYEDFQEQKSKYAAPIDLLSGCICGKCVKVCVKVCESVCESVCVEKKSCRQSALEEELT